MPQKIKLELDREDLKTNDITVAIAGHGRPHIHFWSRWLTFEEVGEQVRSCRICGRTELRPIPPIGNDTKQETNA